MTGEDIATNDTVTVEVVTGDYIATGEDTVTEPGEEVEKEEEKEEEKKLRMMALSIDQFNVDNVVLDGVKNYTTGNTSCQRIPVKYCEDGYLVDLCIATHELMTYGIQENTENGR